MLELNNNTIDINSFNDILNSDSFKQQLKHQIKSLIIKDLIYYKELKIQKFDDDTSDLFKYIELIYNFKTNKLELADLMALPSEQSLSVKDRANCLLLPIYARSLRDNLLSKFVFNSKLNNLTSLDQVVAKFLVKIKNKFKTALQKFNLDMINEKDVGLSNSNTAIENIKIPYWSDKPDNQYTFFPTNMFDIDTLKSINHIGFLTLDESYYDYKKITDTLLAGTKVIPGFYIANTNPDWDECYRQWNHVVNNYEFARAFTQEDFREFFQFVRKHYGDDAAETVLNDMYASNDFGSSDFIDTSLTDQAVVTTIKSDFDSTVSALLKRNVKVLLVNTQESQMKLNFDDDGVEINPSLKSLIANTTFSAFSGKLKPFENNPNVTILSQNEFKKNYSSLHGFDNVVKYLGKDHWKDYSRHFRSQLCFYVF